jgi:ubiquinone biosynthesis monooxygenase Coq7
VKPPVETDTLTVLYKGGCSLCHREIVHVRGLAQRRGDAMLCFVDIGADAARDAAERAALLARFHVQRADGTRLDGAAPFVAMWQRLPGWRWLARLSRLPGALPVQQRLARRAEPAPGLSRRLERELRSDHAGEIGAVFIYRGIATVAARRGDADLLAFAQRHAQAETEHLRLLEQWLPPHRRSRLLGPWRLAGWLTGALPALAGARAVHATIAAVETFVDRHYQQQIDDIAAHGAPEGLLPLLQRCQADECHHRDEAVALAATAGPVPAWLRAWCALVRQGSAAAVMLARRF